MNPTSSPASRLRDRLDDPEIAVLPGTYDAVSAMLAERAGFPAAFTSGFGLSASLLGAPDMGLLTMAENVDRTRSIANAISIPLVADMDTGYGNALNTRRTVAEAIDAGVAGVILEDQEWPKQCGHMDEKAVVSAPAHARRIRAAADVRAERGVDLLLFARTDAREPLGLDEAIRRGHVYVEAGADVVFVEAPRDRAELEAVAGAFDVPTFANMVEGGKTPLLDAPDLEAIGFDVVVYPLTGLFSATRAMNEAFETLRETGTSDDVETVSFDQFDDLIGADRYRDREQAYADRYPDDG